MKAIFQTHTHLKLSFQTEYLVSTVIELMINILCKVTLKCNKAAFQNVIEFDKNTGIKNKTSAMYFGRV